MSNNPIILGRDISEKIMNIKEVTQDSGVVVVTGDVLSIEIRELRSGKFLFIYDISDYTSSITIKSFLQKEKLDDVKDEIKVGKTIKVRGEAQYDKYARDIAVMAFDVCKWHKKEREDTAKEKRVELHLHTQMSSMDAVSGVKDLVLKAAKWGHKAVAITDHGVVQAFPMHIMSARKIILKLYMV